VSSPSLLKKCAIFPAGLYERARKRFKLKSGAELFHYRFYKKRPADALAFLAEVRERTRRACVPRRPASSSSQRSEIRRHTLAFSLADARASRRVERFVWTRRVEGSPVELTTISL